MSSRSLLKFVLPILRLRLTKVVKKCKNAFELSGSLIEKKKKKFEAATVFGGLYLSGQLSFISSSSNKKHVFDNYLLSNWSYVPNLAGW